MSDDLCEEAGLDSKVVQTLAQCHSGYGYALLRGLGIVDFEGRQHQLKLAASSLILGATAFALFDASRAHMAFSAAADAYSRADTLAGSIYEVCAGRREAYFERWFVYEKRAPRLFSPDEAVAVFLLDSWLRVQRSKIRVPEPLLIAALASNGRASVSGLPVSIFRDIWRATSDYGPSGNLGSYMIDPIEGVIRGSANAANVARGDSFHWASMHTRALPLQPQGLASAMILLERNRAVEMYLKESLADNRMGLLTIRAAIVLLDAKDFTITREPDSLRDDIEIVREWPEEPEGPPELSP